MQATSLSKAQKIPNGDVRARSASPYPVAVVVVATTTTL